MAKIGVLGKCGESSNWLSPVALKFDLKPPEVAFSAVISNCKKCQSEVADDVISDVVVD